MTLKAILETLDGLPTELAAEYEEKDGKYHLITPEGFKPISEFNVVHKALGKEREDHRGTKAKLSAFGDLDPEDVRVKLDRLPELEALAEGKIDDAKINQIVESRVSQKVEPLKRQLATVTTERDQLKVTVSEFQTRDITRSMQDTVRTAATKVGIKDTAVEDAMMLAERFLERDETGQFVVKAGAPNFTPGLGVEAWLTQVKDVRPHWWGESGGGGARGSGSGAKGGSNPWSADNWNLTEQGRIYMQDPGKAEQLAKAAGTKIGGSRPAAKK